MRITQNIPRVVGTDVVIVEGDCETRTSPEKLQNLLEESISGLLPDFFGSVDGDQFHTVGRDAQIFCLYRAQSQRTIESMKYPDRDGFKEREREREREREW